MGVMVGPWGHRPPVKVPPTGPYARPATSYISPPNPADSPGTLPGQASPAERRRACPGWRCGCAVGRGSLPHLPPPQSPPLCRLFQLLIRLPWPPRRLALHRIPSRRKGSPLPTLARLFDQGKPAPAGGHGVATEPPLHADRGDSDDGRHLCGLAPADDAGEGFGPCLLWGHRAPTIREATTAATTRQTRIARAVRR